MDGDRYEGYKAAAEILRTRWIQGTYGNPGGPVCMMGAVKEVGLLHSRGIRQDLAVRREMEAKLWWSPTYWFVRVATRVMDRNRSVVLERWNDAPWRRQDAVVNLVESCAKDHYVPWLVNERVALQMKVEQLTRRVAEQRVRIARLEAERLTLKQLRFRDVNNSKRDRDTLAALDQELDETTARLASLV